MALYRNILKQAWGITWRNKYFWFFGLFAAFLGGSGEYKILTQDHSINVWENFSPTISNLIQSGLFKLQTISNLGVMLKNDPLSALMTITLILLLLAFLVFIVWLAVVSQAAIINNTVKISESKKAEKYDIHEGMRAGTKHFWSVLSFNLIIKAVIAASFALVALPLIINSTSQIAGLIYIILFMLSVVFIVAFSFLIRYAICYAVIKEDGFATAFKNGFHLFRKNWIVSAEMAIILFVVNLVVALFLTLITALILIPFAYMAVILYSMLSFVGFWVIFILAMTLLAVLIAWFGAFITAFQAGSWALLFMKLDQGEAGSTFLRILRRK